MAKSGLRFTIGAPECPVLSFDTSALKADTVIDAKLLIDALVSIAVLEKRLAAAEAILARAI